MKPRSRRPSTTPKIPEVPEIERAALGCVFLAADMGSQQQADALLARLSRRLFNAFESAEAFQAASDIRGAGHALDQVTFSQWCVDRKILFGLSIADVWRWSEATPSFHNFPTYLEQLETAAWRRWSQAKAEELKALAESAEISPDAIRGRLAELLDASGKVSSSKRPTLEIETSDTLVKYEPPAGCVLVGDNELRTGYEGVALLAGPGSSGKSLAVAALAMAGARGAGTWMGRKVHRQFKTLIIQAENGPFRLRREVEAMRRAHPEIELKGKVWWSRPPEGGIPFHRPDFRAAVKRTVEEIKPDLVVLDPWSHIAVDDASKDVMDKLAEIRSCFPQGDAAPGLLIVCHTRKPRENEVRNGRSMVHNISGSVSLANTARCAYVITPWSEDPEDDRVLWCCPKLNDGEMYANTVWKRRFGTFFQHDPDTDPRTWGKEDDGRKDKCWLTPKMIETVLKGHVMNKTRLAERLADEYNGGSGASSAQKWLLEKPEFTKLIKNDSGLLTWKG